MRRAIVVLPFLLCSCAALTEGERDTRVGAILGMRSLDEDIWAPTEEQFVLGAECVVMSKDSGLGLETSLQYAADSDEVGNVDVTSTTTEFSVGGRLEMTGQSVRPYVGAGLALINAEIEADNGGSTASEDDSSLAGYAHLGVELPFAERWYVGLDVRALFGSDMEFSGVNGDADYTQFALVIGASF